MDLDSPPSPNADHRAVPTVGQSAKTEYNSLFDSTLNVSSVSDDPTITISSDLGMNVSFTDNNSLGLDSFGMEQQADEDNHPSALDVLMRAWISERMAPEILKFSVDAVGELYGELAAQVDALEMGKEELSRIAMDRENLKQIQDIERRCSLIEFEIDRVRFLLKAYLLARLNKLQKYASWLMHRDEGTEVLESCLLAEERDFVKSYAQIAEFHDVSAALEPLNPLLHSLDDPDKDMRIPSL